MQICAQWMVYPIGPHKWFKYKLLASIGTCMPAGERESADGN
jgi:hypothetical protein